MPVGAANLRLAETFQTDEVLHVNLLTEALRAHHMRLVFSSYGHLYFNVALLPLQVEALVRQPSDVQVLLVMRLLSALCTLGTAWLVAGWTYRDAGPVAAAGAGLLILASPVVMEWSSVSHPDTAQMFLMTVALMAASRAADQYSIRTVALSGAAAGLAFATKYAGLFVLPQIAAIVVARAPAMSDDVVRRLRPAVRAGLILGGVAAAVAAWSASPVRLVAALSEHGRADLPDAVRLVSRVRLAGMAAGALAVIAGGLPVVWQRPSWLAMPLTWLRDLVVAAAAFAAAFALSSPYSLRHLAFLKGIVFESTRLESGTGLTLAGTWLRVIGQEFGVVLLVCAGVGLVLGLRARSSLREPATTWIVIAWVGIYTLVLVTRVGTPAPQYLLPLMPALAWLSAIGINQMAVIVPGRQAAVAACLTVLVVCASAPRYLQARSSWGDRVVVSGAVAGGEWLACAVSSDARVAYDYMAYIPPQFHNVTPTWGGTLEWRQRVDPDIVVVNPVVRALYDDRPGAGEVREYYACLERGGCGFERWFVNEGVEIYGRVGGSDRVRRANASGCER